MRLLIWNYAQNAYTESNYINQYDRQFKLNSQCKCALSASINSYQKIVNKGDNGIKRDNKWCRNIVDNVRKCSIHPSSCHSDEKNIVQGKYSDNWKRFLHQQWQGIFLATNFCCINVSSLDL